MTSTRMGGGGGGASTMTSVTGGGGGGGGATTSTRGGGGGGGASTTTLGGGGAMTSARTSTRGGGGGAATTLALQPAMYGAAKASNTRTDNLRVMVQTSERERSSYRDFRRSEGSGDSIRAEKKTTWLQASAIARGSLGAGPQRPSLAAGCLAWDTHRVHDSPRRFPRNLAAL